MVPSFWGFRCQYGAATGVETPISGSLGTVLWPVDNISQFYMLSIIETLTRASFNLLLNIENKLFSFWSVLVILFHKQGRIPRNIPQILGASGSQKLLIFSKCLFKNTVSTDWLFSSVLTDLNHKYLLNFCNSAAYNLNKQLLILSVFNH